MAKRIFDISPPKELKKEAFEEFSPERPGFRFKSPRLKFSFPRFFSGLLLIILLIVGGIIAYFDLSLAEIEIWPETEMKTFKTKLTIDKTVENINFLAHLIPGKIFEEEKTITQEFSSSGKKLIEKKAEGVIRVFNDSQQEQILVAQTRFQPPLEKFRPSLESGENPWFRLKERIVIPAKSYIDARVMADAPGEKYNIEPSTFSVPGLAGTPKYTFVYGKSFEAMTGGLKKEVSVVTEEDLKEAEKILKEKGEKEIKEVLKNKIPPELVFLEEVLKTEILEVFPLVQAGAELEKFIFQIKIRANTLSFKKEDLENFSKEFIISQIPADKKISEKSLKLNYSPEFINIEGGKIVLLLNLEAKIYSAIDEISLKKGLFGKSLSESQFFLENQPGIKKAKVKLFPFWSKKIPKNLEKIEIKKIVD